MLSRCSMVVLAFAVFSSFIGTTRGAEEKIKMKVGDKTVERTVQLRTHSIYAPYIDQDLQNRWWDFGADAYINTNKHIRLTRDRPSQMGYLWSRLPLTTANFIIEIEFKVSGDSNNLFGDGLAIWLTKERAQPGPVFGNKDSFTGFGLFLDTYANSRHPYAFPRITGMIGDGKTSYDFQNDGDKQGIGACSLNFRRTNVATKIKITYIKDSVLDVKLQYKAWDDWTDCFRADGVSLPTAPFLGMSAMTGDVSDNHDIITVSTHSAIISHGDLPYTEGAKKRSKKSAGSWTWFFFKMLLFAGVGAGGYYGYQEYRRRSRYSGMGNFSGGRSSGFVGFGGAGGMYSSSKRL
ncbi:ERGIC53, mannose lectin, ER-golgi intermediate compartment [Guyanagaster necrorhizus]|uniref:ERGIC53, mannose lectin, ER-golgi intermediate compartment n=1 Tax=Guyanagaster necrorhizus TaxID=856835 RepID=A0A9P7VYL2_9AGAR|nr:ERGIC53, mannose lectin, ER-golgi intermediate compartment [Guyanagaster necrorhizus MCA 3950]KAG7449971.1 ERGIC53, mannose lectin, ER-golgi intermediate compartment [Guyanagaster necrorhizus MCA 3950]